MTVTTPVAQRVLDALGDAFRAQGGPVLEDLVDGLAAPLNDAASRLTVTGRGWPAAFDLDETPDPTWLGAIMGSRVPAGLTVDQAREYVRSRPYWRRGTPAAMTAAVATLLTGSQRVDLIERDGSPWRLTVRVYSGETPDGVTVDDIAAAAATQKPVGIVLTAEIVDTATLAHFAAEHGPTYSDVAADFPTYEEASYHTPEEGTTP